ncbi:MULTISPECIES: cytidine deaminase [Lacticaseibacillus]|uniref:cytidine deaminase n=1 Tax=Lacticaseibacillus TaxID=2759736 RepID=UPI000468FF81|nr:cytidine deaminase [Lacticaseibacillus casei]HAJ53935.1 cytidine deaminase [Lactobacillus sp.]MBI6598506.1 cytidine deaminase [Lacticaseibacillus casei]MBO1482176.1 cytidine deaminase [Lacticaseibacillus casei]MBO2417438.1 cytidine deaminase [Lacticaseibacillus casei]MCK2081841.1 cytidine deaminase [Lacticaseibacillus casei]
MSVLRTAALAARENAYVHYSHFAVGAAVRVGDRIFSGANIENASYGLSNCVERSAIFAAVSAGYTKLDELLVIADTEGPVSPCGACRQVISEFFPADAVITLANVRGDSQQTTPQALLPGAFSKGDLNA